MPNIIDEYRSALQRLVGGHTRNVPKGTKITNDSVSLEAGRKKGTIKRSRPIFADLIRDIDSAARVQSRPSRSQNEQIVELKSEVLRYRCLWEEALAREISLVKQIWEEREERAKHQTASTGKKVVLLPRSATRRPSVES